MMFKQHSRLPLFLVVALLPITTFWLGYITYPRINLEPAVTAAAQNESTEDQEAETVSPPSTGNVDAAETQPEGAEGVTVRIDNAYAPDAETLQLFEEAWQILERDFYGEKPPDQERIYQSIRALTESFAEPHTFFVEPQPRELERDQLRGSFGGIGAYIETVDGGGFTLRPMRGQPAEAAGIREGDRLIAVDGTEILPEMSADDVVALVRGPLDTAVVLLIRRTLDSASDSQELTITVLRSEIQVPSVEWRVIERADFAEIFDQAEENLDEEAPVIGYLRQSIFSERSPEEMRQALRELQEDGATHFILDLRGNPGGLVTSVVAIADLWLDEGIILREEKADGSEQIYEASTERAVGDQPIVIIVDGGSASASEILAGALRDHGRATLVGEKTFGKGTVQLIRELPDGSSIHVTNAAWFTPNNHKLEGEGLTPDLPIEPGSDPLPQALAWLLGAIVHSP